jgi:hypothetical protein
VVKKKNMRGRVGSRERMQQQSRQSEVHGARGRQAGSTCM